MGAMASQITSLTIVYSTVYSDADKIKHQSSASLVFVRGIHRGPVNSPYRWPVTRKMFPFDDVIMIHLIEVALVNLRKQSYKTLRIENITKVNQGKINPNAYFMGHTTCILAIGYFSALFRHRWHGGRFYLQILAEEFRSVKPILSNGMYLFIHDLQIQRRFILTTIDGVRAWINHYKREKTIAVNLRLNLSRVMLIKSAPRCVPFHLKSKFRLASTPTHSVRLSLERVFRQVRSCK